MTKRFLLFAGLLFAGAPIFVQATSPAAAAQVPAQAPQPDSARPGAPRALVLPKILIAGARGTLAALDAQGRLVPGVDVDLSSGGKVTTDYTGRAGFLAPAKPGIFTARITETGQDFSAAVLGAPSLVDGNGSRTGLPDPAPPPREFVSPFIVLQNRFDVLGSGFSGEAYLDTVFLGNLPGLVLAASPVSLVVQPNPQTAPGLAELSAGLVGSRPSPISVQVLALQVIGPAVPVASGQVSAFTVRVSGSTRRLMIEVRSLTPDVVNLARGNDEFWITSGGPANTALIKMRGGIPGSYSLSARLALAGAAAFETADEQLLAAAQVAPNSWQKPIAGLIRQAEHARDHTKEGDPRSAAHLGRAIQALLHAHPDAAVAGLLQLAWQSLNFDGLN